MSSYTTIDIIILKYIGFTNTNGHVIMSIDNEVKDWKLMAIRR